MKVTFIGLGIMGIRMAKKLLENQVDLTVYNRTKKPMKILISEGAHAASTLAEAVEDADIVFSMLSTPEVVESIFLNDDGVLVSMKDNAVWVDCSTVNPSFSTKSGEEAGNRNIRFVDAPVAGSKPQAESGELVFFAGGEGETIKIIEPYLHMMGKKVVHVGDIGKGASFKMLVNIMLAQSMLIFSEAILLGESMGLSQEFLLKVLPTLPVTAPFTQFKVEAIKENDYDVQFPLEWMHKDLQLACLTAYENNQPLFLANFTKELYAGAKASGLGRLDFSAIHKYLEESKTP